jgi:hypothetical protein
MPDANELESQLLRLAYRSGYKRSLESEHSDFEELQHEQESHIKKLISEYKLGLKDGWTDSDKELE